MQGRTTMPLKDNRCPECGEGKGYLHKYGCSLAIDPADTQTADDLRIVGADLDFINNPPHYKGEGLEVIDVIEAWNLDFRLGSCVKYILRAGKKGSALEDLRKARWFLNREIGKLEKNSGTGKD